jgi:hypothetical protein
VTSYTEAFGLVDGKAVPGVTELRDYTLPAGWRREVVSVASGKLPTPIDPTVDRHGPTSAGRCALYGGSVQWKD